MDQAERTHRSNDLGVGKVVGNDLGHFGEMPPVPFLSIACECRAVAKNKFPDNRTDLDTHRVDINFLVEIVQKGNSLNHHGIDLVRRELELEPGVRSTPVSEKRQGMA